MKLILRTIDNITISKYNFTFIGSLIIEKFSLENGPIIPKVSSNTVHLIIQKLPFIFPIIFSICNGSHSLFGTIFEFSFIGIIIQNQLSVTLHHIIHKLPRVTLFSIPVIKSPSFFSTLNKITIIICVLTIYLSSFSVR